MDYINISLSQKKLVQLKKKADQVEIKFRPNTEEADYHEVKKFIKSINDDDKGNNNEFRGRDCSSSNRPYFLIESKDG